MAFNISVGSLNCAAVLLSKLQGDEARSELSSLASSFWEVRACFLGVDLIFFLALFTCCFSEPS